MIYSQQMASERPEPLIDEKESQQLQGGRIDRITDRKVGSYRDMQAFLSRQENQAHGLIDRKAETLKGDLPPDDIARAKTEAHQKVAEVGQTARRELSLASIRAACSRLSDIVGFELQIDEGGRDQFGLDRRDTVRETIQGTGLLNYQGEKVQTGEKVAGALEVAEKREQMRKFDTPMPEVQAVMDQMGRYGKAEYIAYRETGPVLVVLPEIHYDPAIIKENFELLQQMKGRIALLASEGMEGEVTPETITDEERGTAEEHLSRIADHRVGISTLPAEDVLGEEVRTVGAEREGTLAYVLQETTTVMQEYTANLSENPALQDSLLDLEQRMTGSGMSKSDMLAVQKELFDLINKELNGMVINYRNQIWLNSIQQELLDNQDKLSAKNNLTVLVCGAAHQKDLLDQAKYYGFKGAVRFSSHAFQEPIDEQAIAAYGQQMMGESPPETVQKPLQELNTQTGENQEEAYVGNELPAPEVAAQLEIYDNGNIHHN